MVVFKLGVADSTFVNLEILPENEATQKGKQS